MKKDELYCALICALTHDLSTCENCKKCPGENCAEIRTNLIKEVAKAFKKDLPWTEDDDD